MPPPIVAMDFGTATCSVGVLRNGRVEIIANGYGHGETPSYVAFTDDGVLVGEAARDQAAGNPGNTIFDIKRLIGRRISDRVVKDGIRDKRWPFRFRVDGIDGIDGEPEVGDPPEYVPLGCPSAACLLKKLKRQAEIHLGRKINEASLSVPDDFSDDQLAALKWAAKKAGLSSVVFYFESEAVEAALRHLLVAQKEEEKGVLVAHLGRHSLNVAVASGPGQRWNWSGPRDVDPVDWPVFDNLVEAAKQQCGESVENDPHALQRLRAEAEEAVVALSGRTSGTDIHIDNLFDGKNFKFKVKRPDFVKQNTKLFRTIQDALKSVMNSSRLEKKQIRRVLLVGGVARVPKVRDTFRAFFTMKRAQVAEWDVEWRKLSAASEEDVVSSGAVLYGTVLLAAKASGVELAVTNSEVAHEGDSAVPADVKFVFMDTGPSDTKPKCIIQLACKSEGKDGVCFNVYCKPEWANNEGGRFTYKKKNVKHTPRKQMLEDFCKYLKNLKSKKIILVAHHAGADMHLLIRDFRQCGMLTKLTKLLTKFEIGVTDTLNMGLKARATLVVLRGRYIPDFKAPDGCHNALYDSVVLEQLCLHCPKLKINRDTLYEAKRRLNFYISLESLKEEMNTVNHRILQKLAEKDYTLGTLAKIYRQEDKGETFSEYLKNGFNISQASVEKIILKVEEYNETMRENRPGTISS